MIKNITIVGSGALATFYAVQLSEAYEVTVLGTWSDGLTAINKQASIIAGNHSLSTDLIEVNDFSKSINNSDLTIWLTKTYKNFEAAKRYKELNLDCPILMIQNGIGQKEILVKELTNVQIFDGFTNQAAKLIEPGIVENTGNGLIYVEKGFPFIEELQSGNLSIEALENYTMDKLKKLGVNAIVNPLSAIYKVANGELLNSPIKEEVEVLMTEVFPFFQKRKVFNSVNEMRELINSILNKTRENMNSMLADVETNRATEVNSILKPINDELKSDYLKGIISKLSR